MAATLIGLSGVALRAQTEEEVSALLAESLLLPDWETLFTATAGVGYKNNIFLSAVDPESSPFVSASGEIFILRLAPTGPQVTVFGNADARYYWADDVMHEEVTSFNQAALEVDLTDSLQGSIAARYFYQDQVLDVSVTETNRQATPVLGHTLGFEPGLRQEVCGNNWIALSTPVTRQWLEAPLDNYWEVGGALILGHGYGRDSWVTLGYEPRWRAYDTDQALTSGGDPIPGTRREAFQQDLKLSWRHHWDEFKRWRTVCTVGARQNIENGGGYSDFVRGLASARLQYRAGKWEVAAEGRLAYYDYRNQTVSASSSELRRRTEGGVLFELERRLSDGVAWHLGYEYDTVQSNDELETYDVSTWATKVSVEF